MFYYVKFDFFDWLLMNRDDWEKSGGLLSYCLVVVLDKGEELWNWEGQFEEG